MGFIEKNQNSLRTIDDCQLHDVYECLYPGTGSSGIYIGAQKGGKSFNAASIGMRNLAKLDEKILIQDPDSKYAIDRDLVSILDKMARRFDKCTYMAVSGSGKSTGPKRQLEWISNSHARNRPNFKACMLTYEPDSPIGKLVAGMGGNILKIAGRDSSSKGLEGHEYIRETALLDELFELGVAETTSVMARGIMQGVEPGDFPGYFFGEIGELSELKEMLDRGYDTDFYRSLLQRIEDPFTKVFFCGQGVSDVLVKKYNIRMGHVRNLLRQALNPRTILEAYERGQEPGTGKNYVIGESNVPPMDKDSILICVSESGSGDIEDCMDAARAAGADSFLVTRNRKKSQDSSSRSFVIGSENFYVDTCYLFTDILMHACHDFVEAGIEVNEKTVASSHQQDKLPGYNRS